jgi:glucose/arabinose dehydrogenase
VIRNARPARLGVPLLLVLAVLIVGLGVVRQRVLARAQSDVLQSKNLTLTPVVKGLKEPTWLVSAPDGRLFVLERAGTVRVVRDGALKPTPVLDLTDRVSTSTEQGLLCLVFDPHFADNGYVYVDYTDTDRAVQVIRYQFLADDPDRLDPATAHTILDLPKKSMYHNGGTLAFGPDGYLYVSVGDDENSAGAADLGNLYGKILRLDLAGGDPYAVPPSNPFVDRPGAAPEIWSYGLRNPYRISFDRQTGELWIGDVGEANWEEVDLQPASSAGGGGENYGWPIQEGRHCDPKSQATCSPPGVTEPIVEYDHNMNCAVIGGYVYRGSAVPGLVGTYLFGDLCTGGVFAAVPNGAGGWKRIELGFQPIKISSFGEDAAGEVYVVDMQGGVVYRITGGSLPAS